MFAVLPFIFEFFYPYGIFKYCVRKIFPIWATKCPSFNKAREDSTHGHHQMVSTEIRLIIFFAAKDGDALYSQQKQDQELTVAQIMKSYSKIHTQIEECR